MPRQKSTSGQSDPDEPPFSPEEDNQFDAGDSHDQTSSDLENDLMSASASAAEEYSGDQTIPESDEPPYSSDEVNQLSAGDSADHTNPEEDNQFDAGDSAVHTTSESDEAQFAYASQDDSNEGYPAQGTQSQWHTGQRKTYGDQTQQTRNATYQSPNRRLYWGINEYIGMFEAIKHNSQGCNPLSPDMVEEFYTLVRALKDDAGGFQVSPDQEVRKIFRVHDLMNSIQADLDRHHQSEAELVPVVHANHALRARLMTAVPTPLKPQQTVTCQPQRTANNINDLDQRVDQVLAQILGRDINHQPGSFITALDRTFPITNGAVSTAISNGSRFRIGMLSAHQSRLNHQVNLIGNDMLGVLRGIQPFSLKVNHDRVGAIRQQLETTIHTLMSEFARRDGVRDDVVSSQLWTLNDGLNQFGAAAELANLQSGFTDNDEEQLVAYQLVKSHAQMLQNLWNSHKQSGEFTSEKRRKALSILDVIDSTNQRWTAAMDDLGFDINQRRAYPANLHEWNADPYLNLPDATVHDVTMWVEDVLSAKGRQLLNSTGNHGLKYVANEAHHVCITLAKIQFAQSSSNTMLDTVFSDAAVAQAVTNLIRNLHSLAKLNPLATP